MARQSCCPTIPLPRRASIWFALLGGIAFILIAADVVFHGQLQQMDMPIAKWIAENRPRIGSEPHPMMIVPSLITYLGSTPVVLCVALITSAALVLHTQWKKLIWGAITLVGEPVINTILKKSFALPRPTLETSMYDLQKGYTFPSGHTMAVCVAFGILAIYIYDLWPKARVGTWVAYTLLCATVGAALVAIGVHYVSDVLGAYAISACWLGVMASVRGKIYCQA